MQAAAMRRVEGVLLCLCASAAGGKPRIGAALGAVAVQHVDAEIASRSCATLPVVLPIAEADLARHRDARDAKRAIIGEAAQRAPDRPRRCIANDADLGPKLGLTAAPDRGRGGTGLRSARSSNAECVASSSWTAAQWPLKGAYAEL